MRSGHSYHLEARHLKEERDKGGWYKDTNRDKHQLESL